MGFESLKNILRESRQEAAEEEKRRHGEISECPSCAFTPLKANDRGGKHCPICGWTDGPLARLGH